MCSNLMSLGTKQDGINVRCFAAVVFLKIRQISVDLWTKCDNAEDCLSQGDYFTVTDLIKLGSNGCLCVLVMEQLHSVTCSHVYAC